VHRWRHGRGGSVRDLPLTNGIAIRRARRGEGALLPAIEAAAQIHFTRFGMPEIEEQAKAGGTIPPGFVEGMIETGAVYVADCEGRLVAFAAANERDGLLHLMELDVHPDFAGQRIGAALIAALDEYARENGLSAITLSTFIDVPWNAPYYARLGFRMFPREDWGPRHVRTWRAQERDGLLDMTRRCFMIREVRP